MHEHLALLGRLGHFVDFLAPFPTYWPFHQPAQPAQATPFFDYPIFRSHDPSPGDCRLFFRLRLLFLLWESKHLG